ncbi:hypothetical protein [Streptomyces sp. NPDC048638]|uniref:hypothetical protein n=1 Tax=Streptomyces sp. NPDC048638 TaxID=3365580 RepID=UPI0037138368
MRPIASGHSFPVPPDEVSPSSGAASSPPPSPAGHPLARVTAAAVTVSALAASLAGCMSVSDPEPPRPPGNAAQHGDGKDAVPQPGGLTVDGRGDGPGRRVRDGAPRPAGGRAAGAADPSAGATAKAPARKVPAQPVEPSGPVPGEARGHGGHTRPPGDGPVDPAPGQPEGPSAQPSAPPPAVPSAEPTQPPSGPPQPSSQASGQSPSASVSEPGAGRMSGPVEPGDWPDA